MISVLKIALVHRYFWPDTPPYAVMLRYIAKTLATEGHDVTVYSAQPSYKDIYARKPQPWSESVDGFQVQRLRTLREKGSNIGMRAVAVVGFCLSLFLRLLRDRPEVIMIATTPPVFGALAVRVVSRIIGASYVYHCQDIYPEVAVAGGLLKKGVVYRLLLAIDRKNCRCAARVIVLSDDMKNALLERGGACDNIVVINNFELRAFDTDTPKIPPEMKRGKGRFRVLFAGNIGRFQGLGTVVEAAHLLADEENIEFVFLGEGAALEDLRRQAGTLLGKTIKFFGHQPIEVARQIIAEAQLCVVSLSPGVFKLAFPSKTMTYLCEGAPILMMVESRSELARMVKESALGIVTKQGDCGEVARQIRELSQSSEKLEGMKKSAKRYAQEYFEIEQVLPKWVALFQEEF